MAGAGHLRAGRWAEDQALAYLLDQGLTALARNFQCRSGEIDLIMADGQVLVFVEVRYRAASRFGEPFETVTRAKQRKLLSAARAYLARQVRRASTHALPVCRFDVVSVSKRNYQPDFLWIRDAFGQDG